LSELVRDPEIDARCANIVRRGLAYYRHFCPVLRRIEEILVAGEIGRPGFVLIRAFEGHTIPEGSARSWLFRKDRDGGGVMIDFSCHRIKVLLNLLKPVDEVPSWSAMPCGSVTVKQPFKECRVNVHPLHGISDCSQIAYKCENENVPASLRPFLPCKDSLPFIATQGLGTDCSFGVAGSMRPKHARTVGYESRSEEAVT
jgi:hypothetical protein